MRHTAVIFFSLAASCVSAQTSPVAFEAHPSFEKKRYSDTTGTVHTSIRPELYTSYKNTGIKPTHNLWVFAPLIYTGINVNYETVGNNLSVGAGLKSVYMHKSKFNAYFSIMPVSTSFDTTIAHAIDSTGIIPHEGQYFSRSGNRYNYLTVRGGIKWKTASWFNLFAGYDKVFFGDGVRSLLWSDNSAPFWQVRATVTTKKISYVMLYSFLKGDDNEIPGIHPEDKYCSAHYLNWNIGKRITLSFFEAVVWRGSDSSAYRGYDVNYINPIIFYRPVEFNLGSPDNVLIGAGGRLRIYKTTHLYGQLILDEFKLSEIKAKNGWWGNKFGILAGIRSIIDLPQNRFLLLQAEMSGVRPFTYSHVNSLENFGNSMQPIAHPLGANFRDIWMKTSYTDSPWTFSITLNQSLYGSDSLNKNMGYNIYRSYKDARNEYGNTWLQGIPQNRIMIELKVAYWLNFNWNMTAEAGVRYYSLKNDSEKANLFQVFTGLVTRF